MLGKHLFFLIKFHAEVPAPVFIFSKHFQMTASFSSVETMEIFIIIKTTIKFIIRGTSLAALISITKLVNQTIAMRPKELLKDGC